MSNGKLILDDIEELDNAIDKLDKIAEEKEQDADVRKLWLDNKATHNNVVHYEKACKCAKEHRQLVDWLKELRDRRKEEWVCYYVSITIHFRTS